jgi:hypothetical protein
MPAGSVNPWQICTGPDGALWFTQYYTPQIGQAVFVTASLSVTPDSGLYRPGLSFAGSGFSP